MYRFFVVGLYLLAACSVDPLEPIPYPAAIPGQETAPRWWRGNLHAHSLWSDGNGFPELILGDYRDAGYHFAVLSEHDNLGDTSLSRSRESIDVRSCNLGYDDLTARLAPPSGSDTSFGEFVSVRPIPEAAALLNEPGRFLVLPAEELSPVGAGLRVHVNAIGLTKALAPRSSDSVLETIHANLETVRRDNAESLAILNHPNHDYAVTVEDLLATPQLEFLEILSGHNGVRWLGDGNHPSVERLWDIVNSFRIADQGLPPLWGVAADDAHDYYCGDGAGARRAYVQVRATALTGSSLFAAMRSGDFYASSGVDLLELDYDPASRMLSLVVDAQPGVDYEIRFLGTRAGFDRSHVAQTPSPGAQRISDRYDDAIGEVLASVPGTSASYVFRGDELYVRAVVVSSEAPSRADLAYAGQMRTAYTQPYGWLRKVRQ